MKILLKIALRLNKKMTILFLKHIFIILNGAIIKYPVNF